MNSMIHNTQWVTAHFHLIFGGAVIIMYMAIAYEFWPHMTGRPLVSRRLAQVQLGLWFLGMLVLTLPWHVTGLMGMPRRYASFDYTNPFYGRMSGLVIASVIGGAMLLVSVILLMINLVGAHMARKADTGLLRWALSTNPPHRVPSTLNGFGLWNALVAVMLLVAYGFPLVDLAINPAPGAPAVAVTQREP